jgi:hypothetical protein
MHYKLGEEIVALSKSKFWESAKKEWSFLYAYMSEEFLTCLCGHYPIREVCVLKNSINGNETEVGNCCVNKFLNIESANKIFTSVKRIKADTSKSMSPEVLDYLHSKSAITEYEYKFYSSIIRKRSLSAKQQGVKTKINSRLISFTSYEANSNFNKISKVLRWANNHTNFDQSFVLSLKESCTRNGKLTANQERALNTIIIKWKIS